MQRYQIIEALGVPVIPVDGLTDAACFVTSQAVALVRPDLHEHEQDAVLDYLLPRAIAAASCRQSS